MLKSFVQILGFATSMLLLPAFSYAQGNLYKWTDSRGTVHYTNTPTNANATSVDSTLPPASTFKSPAPPPEPANASPPSSESTATPDSEEGAAPADETGAPPTPATTADGSQPPPAGETTGTEPASTPEGEPGTDAQQAEDGTPQLTPEQEQALKDSPM